MIYDPHVETAPWREQKQQDDRVYRQQLEYLFANSAFYRNLLTGAGFKHAASCGGLDQLHELPFTEKDELRKTRSPEHPIGTHLACKFEEISRIFSTSGTTGIPSYIPLTKQDLSNWVRTSSRSYSACGIGPGTRLITAYNAGPFAAGASLDAFNGLGLTHLPMGSGNTERLMTAVQLLGVNALALTPSYALHLAESGQARGINVRNTAVKRITTAGEPGGGEPAMRAQLEDLWGAKVTEAGGVGDICASIWGECEEQLGMHFSPRGYLHFELIDPESGRPVPMEEGATGEIVFTHLNHQGAPLLRFRTRDHAMLWTSPCPCGRTSPRVRIIGRTDDMLIVRAVNIFPSAVREVVNVFQPQVSGVISIRPKWNGVKQPAPLKIVVELAEGVNDIGGLADNIQGAIRQKLLVTTAIQLASHGTLPRSDYKTKLVDFSEAVAPDEQ